MRKRIFLFVLAAMILPIVGCPSPSNTTSSSPAGGGSLTINLPLIPAQSAKNPDPSVPSFYDVAGSGPGNARFLRPGIRDTSVTIDSLAPGDWGVTVNGNNYNGLQVASASVHVTVVEGETVAEDVGVSPGAGDGSLDVSLEWPAAMGIASVSAFLTPEGGASSPLALPSIVTTNGVSSVTASAAVPAGFYTMSRVFIDKGGFASGGADVVRITSGTTTQLALTVASGVDVTITPDISKVIRITFDGWKPAIGRGAVMTVTATPTVSKQYRSFSYQWYLNGGALDSEVGNAITLSAKDLPPGSYRLDCVVAANGVLSSDHVSFSIAGN